MAKAKLQRKRLLNLDKLKDHTNHINTAAAIWFLILLSSTNLHYLISNNIFPMKFSIVSVLFLAITFFSCISASPVVSKNAIDHFEMPVLDTHTLTERSERYPVKTNDALVAKIMANLKANLYANVFASISANVRTLC